MKWKWNKTQLKNKTCRNKQVFFKEEQALEKRKYNKRVLGRDTRVYECPYCNGFHLSSKKVG